MKKLNKKGFTLVELLAVIVILALLIIVVASTALPAMNNARKNSLEVYTKRVVDQAKGLFANAEINVATVTKCSADTSTGAITCKFDNITDIMGADADTTYQILPSDPIVVQKSSGNWIITGTVSGSGFKTVITSASGKLTYTTSES